jgi:hypothetical protein
MRAMCKSLLRKEKLLSTQVTQEDNKMKTCPNCGYENDESHLFCAKCGTKFDDTTQTELPEKQDEQIEEPVIAQQTLAEVPLTYSEKTKFCPNCGKPIEKFAPSCPSCGERLISAVPKSLIIPTEANIAVLLSIVGLVYSICGAFTLTGVVIGIIAIYLGSRANNLIKKETIYGGRDRAIAGIVMGSVAIAFNIIFLIVWVILFSMGTFSDIFNRSMLL